MTVWDAPHVVNKWLVLALESHPYVADGAEVAAVYFNSGSRFKSMTWVSYVSLGCNKLVCGSFWPSGC